MQVLKIHNFVYVSKNSVNLANIGLIKLLKIFTFLVLSCIKESLNDVCLLLTLRRSLPRCAFLRWLLLSFVSVSYTLIKEISQFLSPRGIFIIGLWLLTIVLFDWWQTGGNVNHVAIIPLYRWKRPFLLRILRSLYIQYLTSFFSQRMNLILALFLILVWVWVLFGLFRLFHKLIQRGRLSRIKVHLHRLIFLIRKVVLLRWFLLRRWRCTINERMVIGVFLVKGGLWRRKLQV